LVFYRIYNDDVDGAKGHIDNQIYYFDKYSVFIGYIIKVLNMHANSNCS